MGNRLGSSSPSVKDCVAMILDLGRNVSVPERGLWVIKENDMLQGKLVVHALDIQRTKGTFHAAMWLRLFKFDVEDAMAILVHRKVPARWAQ